MKIYITEFDRERLQKLLDKKLRLDDYDHALLAELNEAQIVEPHTIPNDVITMNSQCRLVEENGEVHDYTLVFPEDADYEQNKISILSPVGCSLIGNTVGSTISFPSPKGIKQVTVEEVLYQPERSGDMDV